MPATLPFLEALNEGIISGALVDTKVILSSCRDSSGRVCRPRALYANSHVLKSVPYFNDLLFGNFSEAELRDFNDDNGDSESIAEDYGYYSDSDLEDDEGPASSALTAHESDTGPSTKPFHPQAENEPHLGNHSELSNKGKIVRIPDIAFVTFQAFIFYLYTGQIEFAPLGSREDRSSKMAQSQTPSPDDIPRPSAKSIYRLADKYDTPALKELALNHIRSGLENCDIIEETFSEFTSRYDDIKMACIPLLVSALRNDTPEKTTWMRLCEIIESHFKGELRHVTDTLSLLWGAVGRDDSATATAASGATPPPTDVNNPANWDVLRAAMIKSIREGVFFDRKYWARYSKKEGVFKPIYFSSIIAGGEFNPCITYPNSTAPPVGETNAESDCESDTMETCDDMGAVNRDASVVLSPGSHSAWRSLFFYKCTGHISFAPLRSQGADFRLSYISEKSTAGEPPPCSPKSIHVLANVLNIQSLCDITFKDIESKLSEDNIVEELFSRTSASDYRILEMECQLLFSKFKNETTMSLVQEKLKGVSGNNLAYRAGAFKLGLRTSLDWKKKTPPAPAPGGIALRCFSPSCAGHAMYIPYSQVGTRDACPLCSAWRMQCVGCGSIRGDCGASCASCGKRFL